jgi:hypothetical protein
VSYWERGRELDQRLLRWMWDDDAKIKWWLWFVAAVVFGLMEWSRGDTGWRLAARLVVPLYFVVLAAVRLVKRQRRP